MCFVCDCIFYTCICTSTVFFWLSACVCVYVCVRVGGNGAGVGGSGLSLLCRDLSTICQPAPGLCAWSCLMKTRCFPWLMVPSRTSSAPSQPTLANTDKHTHAAHLIKTLTYTHTYVCTQTHINKQFVASFPAFLFFTSLSLLSFSVPFLSARHKNQH